jgi:SAM-dependent methyltransferase
MLTRKVKHLLWEKMALGLDIDSPAAVTVHMAILRAKPCLKAVYRRWYQTLLRCLPTDRSGPVLEIGTGGGFLKSVMPGLITSDIQSGPNTELVCDGCALPFKQDLLGAIVMLNTFHHLPDVPQFLAEAARCLKPGGVILMIEPWTTAWSQIVYRFLHHEPFDKKRKGWQLTRGGPLSQSNSALPWIVFKRDLERFKADCPTLRLTGLDPHMPFSYLLCGGFTMRSPLSETQMDYAFRLEKILGRWMPRLAMFATIVLTRTADERDA